MINYYKISSLRFVLTNVSLFYFFKYNILILKSCNQKTKYLKTKIWLKLIFLNNKIIIIVPSNYNKKVSSSLKTYNFFCFTKLFISSLKKICIELQHIDFFNKLKLVGIGFKVFRTKFDTVLSFKLGFSHFIFFKVNHFNVTILKDIKLLIKSDSHNDVQNLLGKVRQLRVPEIYKGKGIFYLNEKIVLKRGKKI